MILLCNPWIHDFAAYDLWMRPVGLLSLAEVLLRKGVSLELVDNLDRSTQTWGPNVNPRPKEDGRGAFFKSRLEKPEVVRHIPRYFSRYGAPYENVQKRLQKISQSHQVKALLLTSSMTYWYTGVIETARLLRRTFPNTPLVAGGSYVELMHHHASTYLGADLCFSRRFAEKSPELTTALEDVLGTKLEPWPDILPLSLRNAMELYPFWTSYPLMTSLGCPFNCRFCATSVLQPRFSRRPYKEVVEEIFEANDARGVTDFVFYDDALLHKPDEHIKPLLNALLENGAGKKFSFRFHTPNGLSPRNIDKELADLMNKTNFPRPRLSLESIDPARAADMSHKVTVDYYKRGVSNLLKSGYKPGEPITYILMGIRGEHEVMVAESIKTAYEAGSTVTVAGISPIPGTLSYRDWEIPENIDPLLLSNTLFVPHTSKTLTNNNNDKNSPTETRKDPLQRMRLLARELNRKITKALR